MFPSIADPSEPESQRVDPRAAHHPEGQREAPQRRAHGGPSRALRAALHRPARPRRRPPSALPRLRASSGAVSLRRRRRGEPRDRHHPRRARRADALRRRAAADPPLARSRVQPPLEVPPRLPRVPGVLRGRRAAEVAAADARHGAGQPALHQPAVGRQARGLAAAAASPRGGACGRREAR